MKHKGRESPIVLQYVLTTLVVAMVAMIIVIFYVFSDILRNKAVATDHARTDAENAQQEISRLQALRQYLTNNDNKLLIEKTAAVVNNSTSYKDQVVKDITQYAQQSGIAIDGFDFFSKSIAGSSSASAQQIGGAKKTTIVVKLGGTIQYDNLLKLITYLETNVSKMQLSSITITPLDDSGTSVSVTSIEIEVYIR